MILAEEKAYNFSIERPSLNKHSHKVIKFQMQILAGSRWQDYSRFFFVKIKKLSRDNEKSAPGIHEGNRLILPPHAVYITEVYIFK